MKTADLFARTVTFALAFAALAYCGGCFEEPPNPTPKEPAETGAAESSSGAAVESSSEAAPYMPEMACMMCTVCTQVPPVQCFTDMLCCVDDDPFSDAPVDCCHG